MSLLNVNPPLILPLKKKIKRKVKYIIISSRHGTIYGAFNPQDDVKAQEYLEILRQKEPAVEINAYYVSNLNLFFSGIKYAKSKERPAIQINSDAERQHDMVPASNATSPSRD